MTVGVYLAAGMLFVACGCADSEGSHRHTNDVKAQIVSIYDEIMDRTGFHADLPDGYDGEERRYLHFHYTYREMSKRSSEALGSGQVTSDDRTDVELLIQHADQIADQWRLIAERGDRDADSDDHKRLQMLIREMNSKLRQIR